MSTSLAFVIISIGVLALVAVLVFLVRGKRAENRITPLASLAFGFVLAGILFGEERLLGYSLMAVGIILSVVDILRRSRGA